MKKIILAVAVILAAASVACTTETKTVKENEKDLVTKITETTNPDSVKVYVAQATAYADSLASAGKVDEAKEYLEQLTPAIEKADPSLKERIQNAIKKVENFGETTADSIASKAGDAVDAVKDAAGDAADKGSELIEKGKEAGANAVEATKDAGKKALDATKETGKKAVDGAKETGKKAVDATKDAGKKAADATKDAAKKAGDKAKDLLNKL